MKKIILALLVFIYADVKGDYWTQRANFTSTGASGSFSFVIGSKGYVGCGVDVSYNFINDFWEYNPQSNIWTQKANFPGVPRTYSSGFSIGNKGYAGLGNDPFAFSAFQDFYEYDPITNVWTQKLNFGGLGRSAAVSFSIGNMGYFATGRSNQNILFNDLWQYDPLLNIWTQKANLPSIYLSRFSANSFVIGNNAYLVAGITSNFGSYTYLSDLWQYNSITNSWIQKTNFPGVARFGGAAFTILNKGYFGSGSDTIYNYLNDFWQYDPLTNVWIQKANVPGIGRDLSAYFSIGNKGYFGIGGEIPIYTYTDWWEYTPDTTTSITNLPSSTVNLQLTPNPAKEFVTIGFQSKQKTKLTITDIAGKTVYANDVYKSNNKISISKLAAGVYTVKISDGKQSGVKKFVKE